MMNPGDHSNTGFGDTQLPELLTATPGEAWMKTGRQIQTRWLMVVKLPFAARAPHGGH